MSMRLKWRLLRRQKPAVGPGPAPRVGVHFSQWLPLAYEAAVFWAACCACCGRVWWTFFEASSMGDATSQKFMPRVGSRIRLRKASSFVNGELGLGRRIRSIHVRRDVLTEVTEEMRLYHETNGDIIVMQLPNELTVTFHNTCAMNRKRRESQSTYSRSQQPRSR